ncbi:hypothetical protein AAU61_11405 [Desulfocarbo indianensis]|nr:hypothetical protein AAU61_11405 [Desulfocarbo indianensis]
MSQEAAEQGAELRIRSAADLERALESPDIAVRLAVLKAVGENARAAMRYGKHQGRDLVDVLIDQVNTLDNSSLRQAAFTVLSLLPGQRVKEALIKELHFSGEPEAIMAAGRRLAQEEPQERRRIFLPFLMQDDDPVKARQAALALADLADLTPEERLRAALLGTDPAYEPPALDSGTWPCWREALRGIHAEYARQLAQRQGGQAFRELKGRWPELDLASKTWLLTWGSREFALDTVELLAQALEQGPEDLALAALRCVPRYHLAAGLFSQAVEPWARHDDPRLKRAAIRAGAKGVDLIALAKAEPYEGLRLAAVERLGREGEASSVEVLAELLAAESWRVRSAAAQALIGLGEKGLGAARRVMEQGPPSAKAAAAQVLIGQGQEEWLAQGMEKAGFGQD